MPRAQQRARTLTIFLLKQELTALEDALISPTLLVRRSVTLDAQHSADLYIRPTTDRLPAWLSLFDTALQGDTLDLHNASSAAVLLIAVGERRFALTFGYGRNLLRPGAWEENFGIRVTLNCVDHQRIRSIDRVKFDAISQHSQIQASRDAEIVEFGLDVEQDLLRAVTGKPRDPTLVQQLTGKDALKADVRVALSDIPNLLARFSEIFNQEAYKEHFSFVDQVNEVRDPGQIQQLDSTLVERITNHEFERLWLAIQIGRAHV